MAVSAFRIDPGGQPPAIQSGNGGYSLVAETQQPISPNLNTPEGRNDLGFSAADESVLTGSTIVAPRVNSGDDASCRNLYRARQPRVLGVPLAFVDRDGFAWADEPRDQPNPWQLLNTKDESSPIPVILKRTPPTTHSISGAGWAKPSPSPTAAADRYGFEWPRCWATASSKASLDRPTGLSRAFPQCKRLPILPRRNAAGASLGCAADAGANPRRFRTRGRDHRPTPGRVPHRAKHLPLHISKLGRLGVAAGHARSGCRAVASVLERRGELALLRATGFRRTTLAWLVLLEHAALLLTGLGVGVLAALLAVLPHLVDRAAPLSWAPLAALLALVLIFGLAAGGMAVRAWCTPRCLCRYGKSMPSTYFMMLLPVALSKKSMNPAGFHAVYWIAAIGKDFVPVALGRNGTGTAMVASCKGTSTFARRTASVAIRISFVQHGTSMWTTVRLFSSA